MNTWGAVEGLWERTLRHKKETRAAPVLVLAIVMHVRTVKGDTGRVRPLTRGKGPRLRAAPRAAPRNHRSTSPRAPLIRSGRPRTVSPSDGRGSGLRGSVREASWPSGGGHAAPTRGAHPSAAERDADKVPAAVTGFTLARPVSPSVAELQKWRDPDLAQAEADVERITSPKKGTLQQQLESPLPGPTTYNADSGPKCSLARTVQESSMRYSAAFSAAPRFGDPPEVLDAVYDLERGPRAGIAAAAAASPVTYSGMVLPKTTSERRSPSPPPLSADHLKAHGSQGGMRPYTSPTVRSGDAEGWSDDVWSVTSRDEDGNPKGPPCDAEEAMYRRIDRRERTIRRERGTLAFSNYSRFRKDPQPMYDTNLGPGCFSPVLPTAREAIAHALKSRRARAKLKRVSGRRNEPHIQAVRKEQEEVERRRGPGMYGSPKPLPSEVSLKFRSGPRFPAPVLTAAHNLTAPRDLLKHVAAEWRRPNVYVDERLPRLPPEERAPDRPQLNTDVGQNATLVQRAICSPVNYSSMRSTDPRLASLDAQVKYYPKHVSPQQMLNLDPGMYDQSAFALGRVSTTSQSRRRDTGMGGLSGRADPRGMSDLYVRNREHPPYYATLPVRARTAPDPGMRRRARASAPPLRNESARSPGV